MYRQNQGLASRPVIVFRGGTSALAIIYGHACMDAGGRAASGTSGRGSPAGVDSGLRRNDGGGENDDVGGSNALEGERVKRLVIFFPDCLKEDRLHLDPHQVEANEYPHRHLEFPIP